FRQETRLARDLEDAEAQEAVDAFAVAEIDEGGLGVGIERLERLLDGVDAVTPDHHAQERRMARLLAALQSDRRPHDGILDPPREGLDDGAGAPLGMQHLLPEG